MLQGPSLPGLPLGPSPGRHATELQATGILLEAELRAAEILNASADREGGTAGPDVSSIGTDVARAIEHHLQALADVEKSLVELGTRALQLEDGEGTGSFDPRCHRRPWGVPARRTNGDAPAAACSRCPARVPLARRTRLFSFGPPGGRELRKGLCALGATGPTLDSRSLFSDKTAKSTWHQASRRGAGAGVGWSCASRAAGGPLCERIPGSAAARALAEASGRR